MLPGLEGCNLSGAVTWVVDAGLDDVVQGEAAGRLLVPQVGVHVRCEHLGHVVVVLAEVGVLLLRRVVHLQLVVGVSERHDDVRAADLGTVQTNNQLLAQFSEQAQRTGRTQTDDPVSDHSEETLSSEDKLNVASNVSTRKAV